MTLFLKRIASKLKPHKHLWRAIETNAVASWDKRDCPGATVLFRGSLEVCADVKRCGKIRFVPEDRRLSAVEIVLSLAVLALAYGCAPARPEVRSQAIADRCDDDYCNVGKQVQEVPRGDLGSYQTAKSQTPKVVH